MGPTRTNPLPAANEADQRVEKLEVVIAAELLHIREHRHPEHASNVVAGSLIGLALSGGGIRSATTNLGVLQALSRMDVLPMVDYVSTVSGGGYIGACLSSLLSWNGRTGTCKDDACAHFTFGPGTTPLFTTVWEDFPFRTEHITGRARVGRPLVGHLRTHGNFLIARWGLLRREAMRGIGTLVTGIVYNLGLFLLTLFALSALYLASVLGIAPDLETTLSGVPPTSGLADTSSPRLGERDSTRMRIHTAPCEEGIQGCTVETRITLDAPTIRERAALNGGTLWRVLTTAGDPLRPLLISPVVGGLFALVVFGTLVVAFRAYLEGGDVGRLRPKRGESEEDAFERRVLWRLAMVMLALIGLTFLVLRDPGDWIERISGSALRKIGRPLVGAEHLVWLFVPFAIVAGTRVGSLLIAVISPRVMGGLWTRRTRSVWAAFQAITMYGWWILLLFGAAPLVIYALRDHTVSVGISGIASLALARVVASRTSHNATTRRTLPPGFRNLLLGIFITLVVGLTMLFFAAQLTRRYDAALPVLVLGLAATSLVAISGYVVDHNKLSPHYFYRDRLGETYLLSEVPDKGRRMRLYRDAMEMPLHCLHGDAAAQPNKNVAQKGVGDVDATTQTTSTVRPWRNPAPYHLISAAINLAGSRDLTRKDRKSDYWLFSKLYCGSTRTGFRSTRHYRSGETKLARAIAISGAAASGAIGKDTFFAQAFATVLFNIRLGYWIENPLHASSLTSGQRRIFWPAYLWREVTMNTVETTPLVNLSDGGHTGDNIGIYPLLQRRCKVIIACDAEQDASTSFGSFTEGLRHAYVDMGIDVDIDLTMIRPNPSTGLSRSHCAVGRIRYPDRPDQESYLIYLKNSLTGDEPEPMLNYKTGAPAFPHESTADQFFDDAQFESYRALGVHLAEHTFGRWVTAHVFDFARAHHTPTVLA
jgi:hypothetical protein